MGGQEQKDAFEQSYEDQFFVNSNLYLDVANKSSHLLGEDVPYPIAFSDESSLLSFEAVATSLVSGISERLKSGSCIVINDGEHHIVYGFNQGRDGVDIVQINRWMLSNQDLGGLFEDVKLKASFRDDATFEFAIQIQEGQAEDIFAFSIPSRLQFDSNFSIVSSKAGSIEPLITNGLVTRDSKSVPGIYSKGYGLEYSPWLLNGNLVNGQVE